ncbi:hypothetical protein [Dysgonomonas sp. 25]|uniref:hypothetical protein n=1 Tax=Dysgonomonas sp. 25 TaxID=2302933 RepID=UPI0013D64ECE|nr:hypothetical protein [Dysgonomonas sp. 25]NDV69976.1 hypothetical protein [Dysgonomonas sp. 25]
MISNNIFIFILPVSNFSFEESMNLSFEELEKLWVDDEIIKYTLPNFMKDINDNLLVDNVNNWIIMKETVSNN